MVDRRVLEFIVCPVTKAGLRYDSDAQELLSDRAKLAYPIVKGVPIMIPEKARILDKSEVKR